MNKKKSLIFFLISLCVFIPISIFLIPSVNPLYGLKNLSEKVIVEKKAKKIISDLGFSTERFKQNISLISDKNLLKQSQQKDGIKLSNEKVIAGMPAYKWELRWNKIDESSAIDKNEPEKALENFIGFLRLHFDQNGNLLKLESHIDDKTKLPDITEIEAKKKSVQFLNKYTIYNNLNVDTTSVHKQEFQNDISYSISSDEGVNFKKEEKNKQNNRTDYKFNFNTIDTYSGNKINISVSVKGNFVSDYEAKQEIPEELNSSIYPTLFEIVIPIVLIIILIIVAFRKFRDYEIGFKIAIFMGVLSALGLLSELVFDTQNNFSWEILIGWVIAPLFIGVAITFLWAVSEANGREVWKEKYLEFDLLINGHLLDSKIGIGLFYGIGLGLTILSVWMIFIFILNNLFSLSVDVFNDGKTIFAGSNDYVYLMGKNIYRSIYKAAIPLAFVIGLLRKRITREGLIIIIGALIWALSIQGVVQPFEISVLIEFIIGLLIIYSFLKFNLFVVLVGLFSSATLFNGLSYFFIQSNDFRISAVSLSVFFGLTVIFALVSLFTRDKLRDYGSIVPAFVKNITERERLQGEIEAAKKIQESFLPLETPEMHQLDISAKCLPALEVGGDYYDFVKHNNNNLSVIIGDVAGKGTKAAFVMTLTKGFFKALTRKILPPAKVLSDINELFYENVGRGSFISMIYGQFDLVEMKFAFARAGHNPVIFKRTSEKSSIFLQPEGIAIGMEKGILFTKTIEEQSVALNSGDVLVLYTDGFTEAMNNKKQQFGEENLKIIVETNSQKSSAELMDIIFKEVLNFIGKEKQYDDMTIIVVKVL
jgi:sigma-B regulation protein RsbU (phosphoserine phosphatase)